MSLKKFINNRNIKKYRSLVNEINIFYNKIILNSDTIIKDELLKLKEDLKLDPRKKTIQAMALAKLAAKNTLGMTYYDVQLLGALALVDGAMAEMKTGEGKTLTCSAAVAANYVLGYTTHVATANEYLAQRDEETLHHLYENMGIKSSFNTSQLTKDQKRQAYLSDVLYSTAQELGFDFLRDNLVYDPNEKIQPRYFNLLKCIIDEADFVLIDEARTPLIISGEAPLKEQEIYHKIRDIILKFRKIDGDPNDKIQKNEERNENGDFWLDEKQRNIYLSEKGYNKLEAFTKVEGILVESKFNHVEATHHLALYDENNSWIINEATNALKAEYLYIKDKDYVVQDNEIIIVDPNTGRLSNGRTWSNGLHQAIEAKENLVINPENMTMGSISIQNYFRNYQQISGMSGTIIQSSEEFEEIYNCKTVQIPTNKPVVRKEYQDRIYLNTQSKYQFMIEDILERHTKGQPILIGTVSVAESEIISDLLNKNSITHHVLNAKNNALEAQIIAQAGQPSRVTVSTSMAGRGTDIILGGNKESIQDILHKQMEQINERISYANHITSELNIEATIQIDLSAIQNSIVLETSQNQLQINALYNNDIFLNEVTHNPNTIWNHLYQLKYSIEKQSEILKNQWQTWREQVLSTGGLCVIGSSRNESRRIDDQLRGRAGRQGDPGENIFYMSLEDPWVNVFGKNTIFAHLVKTLPQDQLISSPTITKIFAKAQKSIEGHHFDIRKHTYQYDSIADEGRKQFLGLRNNLLFDEKTIQEMVHHQLFEDLSILASQDFIDYLAEKEITNEHLTVSSLLNNHVTTLYEYLEQYTQDEMYIYHKQSKIDYSDLLHEKIYSILSENEDGIWQKLNSTVLQNLDTNWSHHLDFIDEAQKNVGLSSLAQKNPIYEYKKICFQSFSEMLNNLRGKMMKEFIHVTHALSTEKNDNNFILTE